jgi:hypothetical protein
MQLEFDVSFGELLTAEMLPLARLKLNVSITAEPWLPTNTNPSDDELYVVPHATISATKTSPSNPNRPANRFDILGLISISK